MFFTNNLKQINMEKLSIKNWAEDDRPREKLLLKGASSLSNAELLAILINNGTRYASALDLGKSLLNKANNSIHQLSKLSVKEILQLKIKGIGEAKAVTLVAALELSNRRDAEAKLKTSITQSNEIAAFLKAKLQYLQKEVFAVVFLNNSNKIVQFEIISEGGITGTLIDVRIILKKALQHNATNIIICHNHPSGNLKPSRADVDITQKIKSASETLDIKLLDHIIVSDTGFLSFKDEGLF
ncbi:RadC family protein [Arachidicoccus ginsenosidimutans]|uniref:RadC family protein n=1 Tax=Arachidicoccus sp. BS20 TaxID=1850526 RepID=UPI001E4E254E|nr:DNA repair protein RadC [Arachidicoccus sp. BS20]